MDACDDVMTRIGKPTGLIRYSSQDAIAGKPRKVLRPRVVLYPIVLAVLLSGLGYNLVMKDPADVTVLRGIDAPFTEEADGSIANQLRIKIANRRYESRRYAIVVNGLVGSELSATDVRVVAPENPLPVDGMSTRSTSVFLLLPRRAFTNGERQITITVSDGSGFDVTIPYRLLGPSDGSTR
jgi:polyferredoxin